MWLWPCSSALLWGRLPLQWEVVVVAPPTGLRAMNEACAWSSRDNVGPWLEQPAADPEARAGPSPEVHLMAGPGVDVFTLKHCSHAKSHEVLRPPAWGCPAASTALPRRRLSLAYTNGLLSPSHVLCVPRPLCPAHRQ